MNLNLENKIIIVSGGAKGIGEGIINALASENAIPVIVGVNEDDNFDMLKSIDNKGFQVVADLTKSVECENVMIKIVEKFGRIDGLVNNADENDSGGLQKGNYELFVASLHQNLVPCYLMAHFALPYLKQSKGAIVNICLMHGETGTDAIAAYTASGGGREALTREWAVELLPYSIRVNAVLITESLYNTGITAFENPEENSKPKTGKVSLKNRTVTSGEIANIVVFLLSERSSHTTGELIPVDSGYTE